jgi:Fic family protein
MTPKAHVWHPITDLDVDPKSLTDGELEPLGRIWERSKVELVERGALDEFQKRLKREWSIETGIIENVYTLDRGVTKTLIEEGINAALIPHGASNRDGVAVARIIQDHYDALEDMFDFVGGRRELSTGYINTLHAALLRNQNMHEVVDQFGRLFDAPLEKGKYKTLPNNPLRSDGSVHEYCPPDHVASEMDNLVQMYARHQTIDIPPEVEGAWLHHRFTQIHPFADGNGRVARALASLVFIKAGWFPLIVKRDDWSRYIDALEKADGGDLRTLVGMFVEAQRNAVIQATEVAYEARPIQSADEAVAAIRDRLVQRGKISPDEWLTTKQTAAQLIQLANGRLTQLSNSLATQVGRAAKGFTFSVGGRGGIASNETLLIVKIGQVADPAEFVSAVQLGMNTIRPDAFVIMAYALGPRYRGIIALIAYLSINGSESTLIEGGTFQINYEEDLASAKARFSVWLENVIVKGLDQWRRTL